MNPRLFSAALGVAVVVLCSAAMADETKLIFATIDDPQTPVNVRVLQPWAARVNEQGNGVIQLDVRNGSAIANSQNFYDRVLSDVVQISKGTTSFVAGKFPLTELVTLPFVTDKATDASVAFWRLYKTGLLDSEYNDAVPLYFGLLPQQGLHFAKPLKSLNTLRGLKINVLSKNAGMTLAALGATPISLPFADIYQGMQRDTIDGFIIQWPAFPAFKLYEVTSFHVEAALGGAPTMVFMAKKRWQALSPEARTVLEDNSGEKESRAYGAFWDASNAEGRDMVKAKGQTIVGLTPAQEALWRKELDPLAANWARTTPGGDKVLATFRTILAQMKAGR